MDQSIWVKQYKGIGYPSFLGWKPIVWVWERLCCPRDYHLFDEVLSARLSGERHHYLACDVCGLQIDIERIITEEEARKPENL